MIVNTPVGVGWLGVLVGIAVLAIGTPSSNSVARCLPIETMMCSGPAGGGSAVSDVRPLLRSRASDFSAARARGLMDVRDSRS